MECYLGHSQMKVGKVTPETPFGFPRWGFLEVCLLGGAGHKVRSSLGPNLFRSSFPLNHDALNCSMEKRCGFDGVKQGEATNSLQEKNLPVSEHRNFFHQIEIKGCPSKKKEGETRELTKR